jgi:hypothetical protein
MRSLLIPAIVGLTLYPSQAANPPNLAMLAAKSAAIVKAAIPGSEGAVQGPLAVVKKRTKFVPRRDTSGKLEVPDDYGAMFIIEFHRAPYTPKGVPVISKTPQFATWRATNPPPYLPRVPLRTVTVQKFTKSDTVMVVDILFGQSADTHVLERAYTELMRFVQSELQR